MNRLLTVATIGIAIIISINYLNTHLYTRLPIHIDGHVDPEYDSILQLFRKNFLDGWESQGAAFTVYRNGQKVIDIWGGYADYASARKWKRDTITVTFSTTKAVAALCIALLVQKNRIAYDDKLIKFWPKFGQHGKQNVTVQWILSHQVIVFILYNNNLQAGLAYIDHPITVEDASDHWLMSQIIENQQPNWPAGQSSGYHVYTYGWLVDQIIRRVDEKKRGIGQFFREEIATPNGIDFHIGLPELEQMRVARITLPSFMDTLNEAMSDYRIFYLLIAYVKLHMDTPLSRAVRNPHWLDAVWKPTFNNPDYHRLEQAAALGIGNARSLAQLFASTMNGSIINQKLFETISQPILNETDIVLNMRLAKGYGFMFHRQNDVDVLLVGHSGHGCQSIQYDLKNQLVLAYVTNGLKTADGSLCRTYIRLKNAVYHHLAQHP